MNILIKNTSIYSNGYSSDNIDILIQDGIVADISTNISIDNVKIIDGTDCFVMPGLVDMHCSLGEPGYEFNESIETGTLSAAKGGFTAITYNPNVTPVIDNKTVVEFILTKAKYDAVVDIYPYGSMTKQCAGKELAELVEMRLSGVVAISDGDLAVQDSNLMSKIFKYSQMLDCPLITHCEDRGISFDKGINDGYVATQLGLHGAINTAEEVIVARNLVLASKYNVHLHITHVSTKNSVEMIRFAKKNGVNVTAETSPHYFILNENAVLGYNTYAKVNPPLRASEDVEAVIEGIKDGTIDVISSDHNPKTIDSKQVEFDIASFGISSFETAFPLAYTYLVEPKIITLDRLIDMMSTKPANILGLNKGKIKIGHLADLVIVSKNESVIDAKKFISKAKFSPFDRYKVKCNIINTFVNGKEIDLGL